MIRIAAIAIAAVAALPPASARAGTQIGAPVPSLPALSAAPAAASALPLFASPLAAASGGFEFLGLQAAVLVPQARFAGAPELAPAAALAQRLYGLAPIRALAAPQGVETAPQALAELFEDAAAQNAPVAACVALDRGQEPARGSAALLSPQGEGLPASGREAAGSALTAKAPSVAQHAPGRPRWQRALRAWILVGVGAGIGTLAGLGSGIWAGILGFLAAAPVLAMTVGSIAGLLALKFAKKKATIDLVAKAGMFAGIVLAALIAHHLGFANASPGAAATLGFGGAASGLWLHILLPSLGRQ